MDRTRTKHIATMGLGCACFFAWMHVLSFPALTSSADDPRLNLMWFAWNGASVLLTTLLFFLGPKLDRFTSGTALPLCSCLTMIAGTLANGLDDIQIPFALTVVMLSIGPMPFWTLWGTAFKIIGHKRDQAMAVYGGILLSIPICLLLTSLPNGAARAGTVLLPIVATAAMASICRTGSAAGTGGVHESPHAPTRKTFPGAFILYIAAFSIPLNFLRYMTEAQTQGQQDPGDYTISFLITAALLAGVILSEALASKINFSFVPGFSIIFSTAAVILFLANDLTTTTAIMALTFSGYFLFVAVMHLRVGQLISSVQVSPSRIFALAMGVNSLGLFAGTGLALLAQSEAGDTVPVIAIGVTYAIFVLGFFAFPRKMVENILAKRGFSQPEPLCQNEYATSMVESIKAQCGAVAHRFGLSAREEEMLNYLVRGWSLQMIAEKECISRNTVKTHTAHIYQKLGVHTREEMVLVVERVTDCMSKVGTKNTAT